MQTPVLILASLMTATAALATPPVRVLDPARDLLSLHYDHAPDQDDGHSAAADRTLLESLHGRDWIVRHVVAVSGAYGKNARGFNPGSDAVMDVAWNDCGGWLSGHTNRAGTVAEMVRRWSATLAAGGAVWVKEGGQSDLTSAAVQAIRAAMPELDTTTRILVVQHSDWNEKQTTPAALAYARTNTCYIKIRDANAYLNQYGLNKEFVQAATAHPVFGPVWRAAFAYYDSNRRLDFSDTGELMRILGLGEIGINAFRERFLDAPPPTAPAP